VFNLLKSIEQNLLIYKKYKHPHCLHHLRVDIKKIKAVFSFAESVYKKKYSTTKLKPLFNKTGEIREIQINIHLLSEFPHPPERIITELKKKENLLIEQFLKHGSRYIWRIKNFRKNVCLPEILPDKITITKYFNKEKQKSNKKLVSKNREDVHRYRTKIKKIMYVYIALPRRIKKEIELNEVEINKLQEKLGDWHDTYSAINFLSNEHFPINTSEYILKLKEKENRQFNALFK